VSANLSVKHSWISGTFNQIEDAMGRMQTLESVRCRP
jgi:hypothetical protein